MRNSVYMPPTLNRRVRIRNPADRPEMEVDEFGRSTGDPVWGVEVWAARRDSRPLEEHLEQVTVRRQVVVWTIRRRDGVDADAQVVDGAGQVYDSVGPPRLMGGVNFGAGAEFLELHTELKK